MTRNARSRLRAARRTAPRSSTFTLEQWYLTALGCLVIGTPALTALRLATTDAIVRSGEDAIMVAIALGAVALVGTSALVPPSLSALRASAAEIWLLIDGPIGPGPVLRPQLVRTLGAAVVVGAAVAIAVAVGFEHRPVVRIVGWACLGAAAGAIAIAGSIAGNWAESVPRRCAITGCAVATTGITFVIDATFGITATVPASICEVVVVSALALRRAGAVSSTSLARSAEARGTLGSALVSGDSELLTPRLPPDRYRRTVSVRFPAGLVRRTVVRDLFGYRRAPAPAVCGVLAVTGGLMLCSARTHDAWATFASVLVMQVGFIPLVVGLRERANQSGADDFEPDGFGRRLVAHLAAPVCAAVVAGLVAVIGTLSVAGVTGLHVNGVVVAALGSLVALATRVWLAGAGGVPLWALSPIASPVGDFASAVFVGWLSRGAAPAALAAILSGHVGPTGGMALAALAAVLLAAHRVRVLGRESREPGHEPEPRPR
jgi:hypothetical protein